MSMSTQYRPEIDGLRAVAVISVLLCHANFALFSGGFVGVDIFFVISGFLITSLIKKDLEAGQFSFAGFWERRIRRILPPLLIVVFTTLVAGWFLYLPTDYARLGQQVAAQSVFASNILFKHQAGYFDTENIIKPLLHTWSLAVEEQFYLFFPIAIYFAWKYRKDKVFKYLGIFTAVSFMAAAFIVRNSPTSAFYLLPFRAWELLVGSLLVFHPKSYEGWRKETLGWLGLLAIALSVFFYNDHILFPGVTALLPCLGAAAIIGSNTGGLNKVGQILSMRIPVFIGLVSYSLYLWHWPILAFTRYSGLFAFTSLIACACLAGAFVLAVLSWKFVETPFRQKKIFASTKGIYIAAFAALLVMGCGGLTIYLMKGVPERLPQDVVQYAEGEADINPYRDSCNKPKFDRFENGGICQANAGHDIEPSFAVWGDSFADAIAPAFYELAKKYKKNGYVITAHGCPPILEYAQAADLSFDCIGFNDRALKLIQQKHIKTVLLAGNWTDKLRKKSAIFRSTDWYQTYSSQYANVAAAGLKHTIDKLQEGGVKVFVLLDPPYAGFNPPRMLAMKHLYGADISETVTLESLKAGRAENLDSFVAKNQNAGITFIDPVKKLCDVKGCHVSDKGHSLYFNAGHLSQYGALYLEDLFTDYFKKDF